MTIQRSLRMLTLATLLVFLSPMSILAIEAYDQDFENLVQSDVNALTNDGWLVFGNVFTSNNEYLYGYGPFGAPQRWFRLLPNRYRPGRRRTGRPAIGGIQ